jgi:phage gp29-like protein
MLDRLSQHIATREHSPEFASLFGGYLPNPDPILKRMGRDIDVYENLRSDPIVAGCIRRRKAAVRGLEWSIEAEAGPQRLAKRVQQALAHLDIGQIVADMLDGSLYGYQPLEVIWTHREGWTVPGKVIAKPPKWFVYDGDGELRFRSRGHLLQGEVLPPRKFLVTRQGASYANPYGVGDLSLVFWPTTFKRGGLKFWVKFAEKYGTPWLVGQTPRGTPKTEVDDLLDRLESMVQDAVAVIPDDASVQIIESNKSGTADAYSELLHYCRGEIAIALLGQNQTTEASSTNASATAGLEVADTLRDDEARMVESAMNQLIRWMVDLNAGENTQAPKFTMWEQDEVNDRQAKRDQTLSGAGLKFTKTYWMRSYNLREDDIAEVTTPTPPATPVAFAEQPNEDGLRALYEELAGDWEAVLSPMVDPIQAAADGAGNLTAGEFLARLTTLLGASDPSALHEMLTQLVFTARLAANADITPDGDTQ